jgi:hypothetical protein
LLHQGQGPTYIVYIPQQSSFATPEIHVIRLRLWSETSSYNFF